MKLSTRARYGLRITFLIALSQDKPVSLSSLVRQTDLSEKYLEQLLGMLRKAGIIESVRGVQGGYYLSRTPEEITIKEILEALNDSFDISDCAGGNCKDAYCPNKRIFARLSDNINSTLSSVSLQDMVDDYRCV